jgi:small subunit ribosomal protein S6e
MASFKFVISDPETRKSYQLEVDQTKAFGLIGKKISDEFDGDLLGLSGYTLKITGGSDRDGFPMHHLVQGSVRKRILLSSPPGFHPEKKGERKRKTIRGNTISADMAQINVKVVKKGAKPLEEILPSKPKAKEEKKEEKPEEKPKEEPKKEVKEEAKEKPGGEKTKKES